MSTHNVTERLARASARRRRLVIGVWAVAVLASAAVIAGFLGSALTTDDDFTGSPESQRAEQLLERAFAPLRSDDELHVDEAVIVSSSRVSASDRLFERRLDTLAVQLRLAGAARVAPGPLEQGHRPRARHHRAHRREARHERDGKAADPGQRG